ncbi:52K [Ovine adenovirus 7]|uniref:52K n=1 Tax=Ovine adenovirus D serotype 7 (isolate OAV287) TaxID=114430 RepID=Q83899_ADEO7|nr:52K [Ovine adenovirus 7]AAA84973.1 52K [Ovine adenovirus 7]
MHPILQNLRSSLETPDLSSNSPGTSNKNEKDEFEPAVGISSKPSDEFNMRRSQRDDNLPKSQIPVVDILHDKNPKMAEERDLMYKSSACIKLDDSKQLKTDMFRPDFAGTSPAQRHIEAAELKRNGSYTRSLEQWTHDSFISHVKQLLSRPFISLGITYLDDFLQTYLDHTESSSLNFQLFTLINHCSENTLKRILKHISKKNEKNQYVNQWLIDLITCIYLIIRDEQNVTEQVNALLVTSNHLALHFAKKATGGFYPTADKLAKTHIFFKRIILGILSLAESIGCYTVNPYCKNPLKKSKVEVEPSDEMYMFSLKGALEHPDSDEDEDSGLQNE